MWLPFSNLGSGSSLGQNLGKRLPNLIQSGYACAYRGIHWDSSEGFPLIFCLAAICPRPMWSIPMESLSFAVVFIVLFGFI